MNGRTSYAQTSQRSIGRDGKISYGIIPIQQIILGKSPLGLTIDHIDGNGLNNIKSNLRYCTQHQNSMNAPSRHEYKGTTRRSPNRWEAAIKIGYKTMYIGLYKTPQEAHHAYLNKAKELFGEYHRAS